MFSDSEFNGDISKWDVSNVINFEHMFFHAKFNQDISNWKTTPNCNAKVVFTGCSIKDEFKPLFLKYL